MVLRTLLLIWASALLLLLPPQVLAADEPPDYPGIGELIPAAGEVDLLAGQAEQRIEALSETDSFEHALQRVEKSPFAKRRLNREDGAKLSAYLDQQQADRARLDQVLQTVRKLQERLTQRLARLGEIKQEWEKRKRFWRGWQHELQQSDMEVPAEIFPKTWSRIESVIRQVRQAETPLLTQQARLSRLAELIQEQIQQLDALFERTRREMFQKGRDSLFSAEFWRQFSPELWQQVPGQVRRNLQGGGEFLQQNSLLVLFELLAGFFLTFSIRRYRYQLEETSQWQFICRHPWATGLFVAAILAGFLSPSPPPVVYLAQAGIGVGSAAVLVAGMSANPRRGLMVSVLAAMFVVSLALRMIDLQLPLYRLYLTLVTLFLLPLLVMVARYNHRAREKQLTWFTVTLRIGAALTLVVLTANIAGYVKFSLQLLDTAVESVFVGVFTYMFQRLAAGGISYLIDLPTLRKRRFFRQSGASLKKRLHRLVLVLTVGYAALFLLQSWGLFHSVGLAWETITGLGFGVGEFRLTVGMLVSAVLALYLTLEASWLVQGLVDQQVLARRDVDRGVRDAFKKLLHYGLVLLGLLFALGLLGVELQHFVVVAGAFGVGIGFGLQDIVNNFLSGIILLFERPIKVGDGVLIDGEYGVVQKIGLRSTVVETLDQSELIVPNSQIISQKLTNWTLSTRRVRVVVPVGVAYGSDVPLVLRILIEAGEKHADVLEEPAPSPIFAGFGDSSLDFELRVWIADVDKRPRVKSELLQYIDQQFREEGVEIPFPQRDLHLRSVDGEILERLPE